MIDWHILGAGAMGCLWACYLHKAGHHVELLLKDQSALTQYLSTNGVILDNKTQQDKLPVAASITKQEGTIINHLLVTTKAHQTMTAMDEVVSRMSDHCQLLLLQNGMGIAEQLSEKFPKNQLFCGVSTDGAYSPEPFTVVHAGVGDTYIGSYKNSDDTQALIEQLPAEYLHIKGCDDIKNKQLQKLAINCAINGLTVIYDCRNGELLNNKEAKLRLAKLCDEIARLGKVLGHEEWTDNLYSDTESVIRSTAANYSSMYQDINNKRITEIDYINGYLIDQAKRFGITCPENEKLYQEIKQKEQTLNCRL